MSTERENEEDKDGRQLTLRRRRHGAAGPAGRRHRIHLDWSTTGTTGTTGTRNSKSTSHNIFQKKRKWERMTSGHGSVVGNDEGTNNHKQNGKKHGLKKHREEFSASSLYEQGHVFGNFKQYYSFHSSFQRVNTMSKMLEYIAAQKMVNGCSNKRTTNEERLCTAKNSATTTMKVQAHTSQNDEGDNLPTGPEPFVYCDLGCNEGELTVQVAQSLFQKQKQQLRPNREKSEEKSTSTSYSTAAAEFHVTGIDMDDTLIQRARQRFGIVGKKSSIDDAAKTAAMATSTKTSTPTTSSQVESNDTAIYHQQQQQQGNIFRGDIGEKHPQCPFQSLDFEVADACRWKDLRNKLPPRITLLSLFSTTMWLHVHLGDEQFCQLLSRLCARTTHYIIIEPQTSKSYRSAAARLKKLTKHSHQFAFMDSSLSTTSTASQIGRSDTSTTTSNTTNPTANSFQTTTNKSIHDGPSQFSSPGLGVGMTKSLPASAGTTCTASAPVHETNDEHKNRCKQEGWDANGTLPSTLSNPIPRFVTYLDVSTERLRLRANIEDELDRIMDENGFIKDKSLSIPANETEWKRSIRLYERCQAE